VVSRKQDQNGHQREKPERRSSATSVSSKSRQTPSGNE
jgi:hypothetical protein